MTTAPHEHPSDPHLIGWIFAAAEAACGVSVCGWCRRFLRLRHDLAMGEVSHGLCPGCADKHFPKVSHAA